jgi:hypothetical protein
MQMMHRPQSSAAQAATSGAGRSASSRGSNAARLETLNGAPQLGRDADWSGAMASSPAAADVASLFGETTNVLREATHLQITGGAQIEDGASLGGLPGQQLLTGLIHEGWATESDTAAEALATKIDEGGVEFLTITDAASGTVFDWLRFYMGDTEVGYFFPQGSAELVGLVSDGDIYSI